MGRRHEVAEVALPGPTLPGPTLSGPMLVEVMAEVAELDDPKTLAVNERRGDDHGVNLSKPREARTPRCTTVS